ncbi:MAG: hypothetical protein IKS83_00195 [Victivallales bacterium]|nr:hypothetical protein [Victivallales bacterium]
MKKQFTLVELLTVVGIIIILAGLLLPAVSSARAKAQVGTCLGNLRSLMQGASIYSNDWKYLPFVEGADDETIAKNARNYVTFKDANAGKNWWTDPKSWAYKLYDGLGKEASLFRCASVREDNSDLADPKHAISYESCFEVGRRKVAQVLNADSAIYVYENATTSNTARSRFFSQYHKPDNNEYLQQDMWKIGDSSSNKNEFLKFEQAHKNRMNAGFVDGHAGSFSSQELLREYILDRIGNNVNTGGGTRNDRHLRPDYFYLWFRG